jgi:hypothetical protein
MGLMAWAFYYEGYNHADNEDFDYEEARLDDPYWLKYYQFNMDDTPRYQLSDWSKPTLVALDRRRQKNAMGDGYAWCLIHTHKTKPNYKLMFLFSYGNPDIIVLTKPINTQHPEVKKILQYTRYPECEQGIGIYSDDKSPF